MAEQSYFYDFDTYMIADHLAALLDGFHTAHIHADGRIELQCTAAGSRLRIAEHNSNLFTQLVDKDHTAV